MKIFKLRVLIVVVLLTLGPLAQATVYLWNSTLGVSPDSNWSDSQNWLPSTNSPSAADTAFFGSTDTTSGSTTVNNVVDTNTTISALTYTNTTSGTWHVTDIPAGVTLTVSGAMTVGGLTTSSATYVTSTAVLDSGTLAVAGNLTIGNNNSATAGSKATLDLSGLGTFLYNDPSGAIALSTGNRSSGILLLAATNNITAGTISDNTAQGSSSSTGNLTLGAATNVINAGALNVGGGRGSSTIAFPAGSTGGLRLRGVGGTDTDLANVTLGNRNNGGGSGNTSAGTLSLNGHQVDMKLGTLTMGFSGSNPSGNAPGNGILLFDTGAVFASNIVMATTTGGTTVGVNATGTIGVGASTATLYIGAGGMSMANQASATGPAAGNLNITNGTVYCSNNIVKASTLGTATINLVGGAFYLVSGTVGTAAIPIDNLNFSSGSLHLNVDANATAANLNGSAVSASATTITIDSATNISGLVTIHLISYNPTGGDPYSGLTLAPLPSGYTGNLVDNSAAGMIDLSVIPAGLTISSVRWVGAVGSILNSNWDVGTTADWLNAMSAPSSYANADLVAFDDTASNATVTLVAPVTPSALNFTNSTLNYKLNGAGSISGSCSLYKTGSASLTLAEAGGDSFSGGIHVNGGMVLLDDANSAITGGLSIDIGATLQIGSGDAHGNLPTGPVTDNGSLIFDSTANITAASSINGAGSVTQNGSGRLTLPALNGYTGNTAVNAGTLAVTNANSLTNSPVVSVITGTLDASGASGTTILNSLTLSNSAITVSSGYLLPGMSVASLTAGGSSNIVNVASLPPIASYPSSVTLIQSAGSISGFNFTAGTLPSGYAGNMVLSVDGTAVQIKLTNGPAGARPVVYWSGADSSVSTNWSDASDWQLPGAPMPGDVVVFNNTAAQSTSALSTPGGGPAALQAANLDNAVNGNFNISSLTYSNTAGNYHNTFIARNSALNITNTGGLVVGSGSTDFGATAAANVTISGVNGTLSVSNTNASVVIGCISIGGSPTAMLDMSALGNFKATVSSFYVGTAVNTTYDSSATTYLAQTNVITASGGSPNEGGSEESLSFSVGQSGKGSTGTAYLYLGWTNNLNVNSMGVSIAKQPAQMLFNPVFSGQNPGIVIRAADGVSPVSSWSIGDALAQNGASTSPTGTVDFSEGTVNALVGTMYVGRSANVSGGHSATGNLAFGAGTVNVGTMVIGYQPFANSDYGVGNVTLNGPGALVVDSLTLALTTGSTGAASAAGTLTINGGGVWANTISAGTNGATSTINVNNARLVITNSAGSSAAPLTALGFTGGALALAVNGSMPMTNVVATTVTAAGTALQIVSLSNVGVGTNYPLISYTGTDPISGLTLAPLPAGYSGALVDDAADSLIELNLSSVNAVTPPTSPVLTSVQVQSGTNLVISGTNAAPSGAYYILTSTNLGLARTNWTRLATNSYSGGVFSFTNSINKATPSQFYLLQAQ